MTWVRQRECTWRWIGRWTVLSTLLGAFATGWIAPALAGTLTRERLVELFPAPLIVGEKYAALPVWPIFQQGAGAPGLMAHVFETVDIEPVAGYGGKPLNLLVVVDREGKFLDVRLIAHHEPIFMSPRGTATLDVFARQYKGLSADHNVQILSPKAQREQTDSTATLHGVTAGTVSAVAIGKSIMEAAAQVAQARLGEPGADANAQPNAPIPRGPNDRYARTGWNALVVARLVQSIAFTNREVEARFKGSAAAGRDAEGMLRPNGAALDLWVAPLGLPQAGRNLLDAAGWQQVRDLREAGVQTFLVFDSGRYALAGGPSAARSLSLSVRQGESEVALHELPYAHGLLLTGQRSGVGANASLRLFRSAPGATLGLKEPMTLLLRATRRIGDGPSGVTAEFEHRFAIPDLASFLPVRETPQWLRIWQQRELDLAILGVGLAVLAVALARQSWLSASARRLAGFRVAYLVFTLLFIGWIAQGQLTIVNLTSTIEALSAGRSAEFLLADPMAVVLWAVVGVTLLVWGRGTFCGWLCPFGAFQELLSRGVRLLGWKPKHLRTPVDAALKRVKYLVLALIVLSAFVSEPWSARLVEIEPFKTSISMSFQRDWPYVAWALLCLAASVYVYRGFCRYLCPLGAGLAVLGRVRLLAWIPRRAECGTPCQSCRHRCEYQAIAPSGKIDYEECFQCLDCVAIHDDPKRCMPLIRERKQRVIPLRPVPA